MCRSDIAVTLSHMSTPETTETFRIPLDVAEAYEERFVPALFSEWATALVDAVPIEPRMEVLDVACGTGVVTRTIADRLHGRGSVIGLDLNEAMITVARRIRPDLEFRTGDVADLPFADHSFDLVTCSMAMFFFPDRVRALSEMARVTRSGGTVTVVVPSTLDAQPAWKPFVDVAARHAGPEAISLLSTYWSCGDVEELRAWFAAAGLPDITITTKLGTARFPSAEALVATEVESTPLIERISDDVFQAIQDDSHRALAPFLTPDGRLDAPIECHIVTAGRQ